MESDSIMHLQHGPMMTSLAGPLIAAKVRLIRILVFEFLSRSEGGKLERISEYGDGCFVRSGNVCLEISHEEWGLYDRLLAIMNKDHS